MEKLQFKTNINCGNCIKAVTNFIENVDGLQGWKVDTDNPDKILTVEGDHLEAANVIEAIEDAGFDIEYIEVN